MTVFWLNESAQSIPWEYLEEWVNLVINELQKEKVIDKKAAKLNLGVAFFGEEKSRQMNRDFRQKDYATDILSFESDDPESLGDLALCSPVVVAQAAEHGLSFKQECAYLILHGILHLLGYEHEGAELDAKVMYDLQDKIFAKIDKIG